MMREPLWQSAASFAARKHEHDKRDDGQTPYFSHPARVAMTVSQMFGCRDEAAIAAAFLHDTIENTGEGYDTLEERFGAPTADMVAALTKNMMLPGKRRERDYLDRLGQADWRARLVKLADQYDNLSDALAGKKEGLGEELTKCKRIISLAASDAGRHRETKLAIDLLNKLMRRGKRK